ncbi:UDP-N-acetylglucosamine 2-epimerase (hydrolyzing) [Halorubrum salinarum]|uniref:UDP-N-acetylglucosamine 2-epimerase (Hydrolyzing) n=1 Tax=Halorubrum salinarum TaxID=2739057 RepID=A0A7D4BR20_9EURY|nr:UDP-N-acetylglucosamine 2-epimerase [Halorubrum salinarum]QKG92040.1 UDP-N-acetylglucosamine 2-epimerase (hydrolyzing) [Halorubrum salinarum]
MTTTVVSVVTSRSQYARVKTALQALTEDDRVDFYLIVSGGALVHRFGDLSDIISEAGMEIDKKIHTLLEAGEPVAQAKTTGMGLVEYATAFEELDPDMMLTSGDRHETIASSLAASYLNIPVVHLEGGEITGSIDDKVRHATTKMADYHFVSTKRSKEIVSQLGEPADRIYRTGCPSIELAEQVVQEERTEYDPQTEYGGVGDTVDVSQDYIVIQYHPLPTEYKSNYDKTQELITAYEQLDIQAFWFWPNMDAGTDQVSKAIREYREQQDADGVRFFISLDPHDYLTLVKNAACMLGNSSVGIRECSYFGTPAVNIGERQQSREQGPNVLDVDCDADKIAEGVRSQLQHGSYPQSMIYGNGNAAQKITDTIVELDPELKPPMTPDLVGYQEKIDQ